MGAVNLDVSPDGFTTVLLDEPERRNALDRAMVEAIRSAVDDSPGRVLVLGTSDSRAFSSGAGLHLADEERAEVSDSLYSLYQSMRNSPKIIIAAAPGHAVGGGAQLLIACDIRIGSPDLSIRFAGPGHGLVVGAWGLPDLVGRGRALDLCLSMRAVSAEEALSIGLVDQVHDDPLRFASEYAARVSALDPRVIHGLKRIVSIGDTTRALAAERELNSRWDGMIPERDGGDA